MNFLKNKNKGDLVIDSNDQIDPNAWMVTFGDLIMLLLTFFVLLLTMKSMDSQNIKNMFVKYNESLGFMKYQGGVAFEGSGLFGKSVFYSGPSILKKALDLLEGTMGEKQKEAGWELSKLIKINQDNRGVIITVDSDNLFDSGRADLKIEKLFVLNSVGEIIKNALNDIVIMGHTDDRSVTKGFRRSNWDLSFYRALSVYYYMTDSLGVNEKQIAVGGYGDTNPLYVNDTEAGRGGNRRVEFVLKLKKKRL